MEEKAKKSEKLQMGDILINDAQLSAFDIEENAATKKFIEETQKRQEDVLKLKEVAEERLRMIVRL